MSTTTTLKLTQYMPRDLAELILQYSYVDTYADQNGKNFGSLVFRRNFIWCSMDGSFFFQLSLGLKRSKIPAIVAELVSEYSLLPPSAELDCQEEEQYERLLTSRPGNTQVVEEEFLNFRYERIRLVNYKWDRRATHYLRSKKCRLSLTITFEHYDEDKSRIEIFDTMDPYDVKYYNCFSEELNITHLETASLSFYYREFLDGHCQCSFPSCLGKKRLT